MNNMNEENLKQKLREFFEANFQYLKETSGHSINETMKENAFEQVMLFWEKNKEIMSSKNVRKIRLSVPEQLTPNEKIPYTIDGEINIFESDEDLSIFDITTQSLEQIEENISSYKEQLNIYAYILENIQGKKINKTSIISTALPRDVRYALRVENEPELKHSIENWDPIKLVEHNSELKEQALTNFGKVVENIHNCNFEPREPSVLSKKMSDGKTFANHVCDNCDLKYSCEAFFKYKNGDIRNKDHFLDE